MPAFRISRAAALALALAAASAAAPGGAAPNATDKSVFVAALDGAGRPVEGLTLADFRLREDGVDREILHVAPATTPLQLALLVDTSAQAEPVLRELRTALGVFIRRVHEAAPDAPIALTEFGQAAVTIVPFVTASEPLLEASGRLVARPNAPSVLMEAVIDASNRLSKRPSRRRAIVSVNLEPSAEQSRETPRDVDASLRRSGAQLWAVSVQRGQLRNANRDVVLDALTRNTGGQREFLVDIAGLTTHLERYADALTSQYEVTYRRPAGRARVVQVGIMRTGVKVHASGYAPE